MTPEETQMMREMRDRLGKIMSDIEVMRGHSYLTTVATAVVAVEILVAVLWIE